MKNITTFLSAIIIGIVVSFIIVKFHQASIDRMKEELYHEIKILKQQINEKTSNLEGFDSREIQDLKRGSLIWKELEESIKKNNAELIQLLYENNIDVLKKIQSIQTEILEDTDRSIVREDNSVERLHHLRRIEDSLILSRMVDVSSKEKTCQVVSTTDADSLTHLKEENKELANEVEVLKQRISELEESIEKSQTDLIQLSTNVTKKITSIQDDILPLVYSSSYVFQDPKRANFLTSSFSILLWIKIFSFRATNGIFGCEEANHHTNHCLHAYLINRKPYFGFWSNDVASDTELLPNIWTHLSFTYDAPSRTGSIFINGKLDKQRVGMEPLSVAHPMTFGRWDDNHPLFGR